MSSNKDASYAEDQAERLEFVAVSTVELSDAGGGLLGRLRLLPSGVFGLM